MNVEGVERGYVLIHTHTPIDERNHVWRIIINCPAHHMSKGDPSKSTARRASEMFPDVAAEDLWAVAEQQKMFEYPDEGYSEVFLKPDLALRRARKIFADMHREETAGRPAEAAE